METTITSGSTAKRSGLQLSATELALRRRLQRYDSSPFISHLELEEGRADLLRAAAKAFVRGKPEAISRFIQCYPLSGLWVMVKSIAENYGHDGNAVYQWIAHAYGVSDIPNQHRAELNRTFRTACRKLGLSVAGFRPVGFVDDYVFQAGVADNQLPALVDAFVQAEAILGLPPDDDTRRLYAWQDQAAEFAPWQLSRLRNILCQDEIAYHALCYARVRQGVNDDLGLGRRIAAELEAADSKSLSRRASLLAQPKLVWVDDALVIQAPNGVPILASIGGRDRRISGGGQLVLGTPWPAALNWKHSDEAPSGSASGTLAVLDGERKLLAFDADNGSFLRAVTDAASATPVYLDARQVVLIASSAFSVNEEAAVPLGRQAFGLAIPMSDQVEVAFQGYSLLVAPPSRPQLELELVRIGSGGFGPVCGNPSSARVRFPGGRPEGLLELVLEHPSLSQPLTIVVPDGEDVNIDLTDTLPQRGLAGPLRASVNMKLGGRPLVRSSVWVWPGLVRLIDGLTFEAPTVPQNLAWTECRHVARDSEGRISLVVDEPYRAAKIAFVGAKDWIVPFEILRPGITVSLVSDEGRERFVPFGATLSAGRDSTDSLVIRCSEIDAGLDVRGQAESNAFGRTGVRRIAMAALAGQAPHDEIRFRPRGRPEAERVLVKIAPTASPEAFVIERLKPQRKLTAKVSFYTPMNAMMLVATNLATDERIEAAAAFGRWQVGIPSRGLVQAEGDAPNSAVFAIDYGALPPGVWVGELLVGREDDTRWMPLANARGDRYVVGLSANASIDDLPEFRLLFLRLTEAMNSCIAVECWPSYSGIVEAHWNQIGKRLAVSPEGRRVLLEAVARPLPIDVSPTWVPLRHPVELAPDLFTADADAFQVLASDEMDGGPELGAISKTVSCERLRDAIGMVDPSFFHGFDNFMQAARSDRVKLQNFSFQRFKQALKSGGDQSGVFWRPRDGRLSAAHHAWCVDRLVERVERVAPDGLDNNLQRMPQAAHLANIGSQIGANIAVATPDSVVEQLNIAGAVPALFSVAARAFRRGESTAFWSQLVQRAQRPQSELLRDFGFLTRIAPELLGFYLLLWELERRSHPQ